MTRSQTIQKARKLVWPTFWRFAAPHWPLLIMLLAMIAVREGNVVLERWLVALVTENLAAFLAGTVTQSALLDSLLWIALAFSIAIVITAVARFAHNRLLTEVEMRMLVSFKHYFFSHITRLSHRFHTSHKSGTLISRMGRGASALEHIMDNIVFNFAPLTVQLVFSVAVLAALKPVFAIIVFATIATFVLYSWIVTIRQQRYREQTNDREDEEKATVADSFMNIETIKYFGKEQRAVARYDERTNATRQAQKREWDLYGHLDFGHTTILGIGLFFLIAFSVQSVMDGTIGIAGLTFTYTAYLGLVGPMGSFVRGIRDFARTSTDLASLAQYLTEHNDIIDELDAKPLSITRGAIAFEKVTFTYRQRVVINNLTLHVKPGEKIALVGSSGAGKSTMVKLLYRFYDPQQGTISVDERDIKTAPQEQYREQLAIVPQEGVLFDDTLYNNIAFSKPTATKKDVLAAMRLAQLTDVVQRLPEGPDTIVGERGIKLSGGERQRVAIARAILANTKVLVLDEATSSLDSETEHAIQRGLKALLKGRTAIIIAHRLSTIMHADRIIVLENGRIIQQGSHRELLKKPGRYKTLWKLQKGGYIGE